jgi:hypothetical protein
VQFLLLLFYQTHGRFVLFGSPIFKLTMNSMFQKTKAAEVILHGVYPMSSWFQLCTGNKAYPRLGPGVRTQLKGLQIHRIFVLLMVLHCYLVRCNTWKIFRSWH